ncbi:MAG: ArsR family transcriptional regulator [Ignavibacteria bacterium]|nr:MAG: ArsR family transcriptional regulator [Ignavibacteria bacterium]
MLKHDELISELFSALAHPYRLRIVEYLRSGERCQCELPDVLQAEQSNISRHVKVLVAAGVIRQRKDGIKTMLRVRDPEVFKLIDASQDILREYIAVRMTALNE